MGHMTDNTESPKIIISEITFEEIIRQLLDGELKDFKLLKFDEEGRITNREILD